MMEEVTEFRAATAERDRGETSVTQVRPTLPKKVRILCVIGSMGSGGSERQMIGLLTHLDRKRFAPMLYTILREGPLLAEVPDDVPVFSFDGGDAIQWNWPGRIHARQVRHLANTIQQQHIDLVYDRTFHATLVAGPACGRTGTPHLCTIVANPKDALKTAGRFVRAKRYLLRHAYLRAAKVVTVSDDLRENAIAYYRLPRDHVLALRNWIDLERIDRLAVACESPFAPQRFHVVVASRLVPLKGQRFLLEATEDVALRRGRTSLLVHLIGEGPDEPILKKYVADHGLAEHVRFEGLQLNPFPFMRAAHLFCLPSLFEGMPNALLEAMACRVPVLATDCPTGPREVLDGGRLGRLVPPGNPAALANAVEDAMLNHETWLQCTENARRHVEEVYGPKRGLAALESLFLNTVARR
jgi:glycosyltransferase involved in cell wall biosynthesis